MNQYRGLRSTKLHRTNICGFNRRWCVGEERDLFDLMATTTHFSPYNKWLYIVTVGGKNDGRRRLVDENEKITQTGDEGTTF